MKLIWASAPPRRKEILTTLGVEFTVRTADADESCDLSDPGARVEAIALKKALAVQECYGAMKFCDDTVVSAATKDGDVDIICYGAVTNYGATIINFSQIANRVGEI